MFLKLCVSSIYTKDSIQIFRIVTGFAVKKWLGTTDKSVSLYCAVNSVKFYKSCFHDGVIIPSPYFLNALLKYNLYTIKFTHFKCIIL